MQVGGVSAADVSLEQVLAAVPDLDDLVARLRDPALQTGADSAAGRPARAIRFESVAYRYPGGGAPVYQGLDLELTAGSSLALVGSNGAGKTGYR
jgi:ABC-type bacteriocin/lantibiotic exporter with double-glycine peptidase domain